jgi:hypothetical protein
MEAFWYNMIMNHEVSKNSAEINTAETEWDSLEKEVEFQEKIDTQETLPSEAEKIEYIGYAFDAIYGKSIDSIIRNSCFDGDTEDERKNPDNYVVSCALSEFLSDKDQQEMIQRFASGEPVTEELKQKFKDGIIGLAVETGIVDELMNDPLLRKRRADECAGRYNHDIDEKERNLQTILWNADEYFFGSPEAQGLLEDRDFIMRKYNIEKLVEASKDYNPGQTEETLAESYISDISECIHAMVERGEASIEDIIKDPFFRKRHFDEQYAIELEGKTVNPELSELWRVDIDFHNSYEYGSLLFEYAKKNPKIYEKVNEAEIDKLVSEALAQVSDKQMIEIVKAYEKNPRKGDALIAKILIPILGLSDNPPTLKYGSAKDKEGGYYKRSEHSVTICEDILEEGEPDNERILNATSSIFDVFRPKKLEDKMFYRMGAVAHEFWHARQWAGSDIPAEKQEQYRKNFVYYMSGHSYYDAYRSQLIEAEAWAFGKKVEKRCKETYDQLRGNKK